MQISRAAALSGTISVKLSTSCSARYLLLTAVTRPPPLEVEVAPVSTSRLLKKGVYPLSQSAAAACISCTGWRSLFPGARWQSPPTGVACR